MPSMQLTTQAEAPSQLLGRFDDASRGLQLVERLGGDDADAHLAARTSSRDRDGETPCPAENLTGTDDVPGSPCLGHLLALAGCRRIPCKDRHALGSLAQQ